MIGYNVKTILIVYKIELFLQSFGKEYPKYQTE